MPKKISKPIIIQNKFALLGNFGFCDQSNGNGDLTDTNDNANVEPTTCSYLGPITGDDCAAGEDDAFVTVEGKKKRKQRRRAAIKKKQGCIVCPAPPSPRACSSKPPVTPARAAFSTQSGRPSSKPPVTPVPEKGPRAAFSQYSGREEIGPPGFQSGGVLSIGTSQ